MISPIQPEIDHILFASRAIALSIKLEYAYNMSIMNRHIIGVLGVAVEASIVDLRYKTKTILEALDRNESVTVLYHGKIKGVIKPAGGKSLLKVIEHPFFGMNAENDEAVLEELEGLRKPRYDL